MSSSHDMTSTHSDSRCHAFAADLFPRRSVGAHIPRAVECSTARRPTSEGQVRPAEYGANLAARRWATIASASASAFPAEAAVASGNTVPLEAMATYTVDYTGIPGHVYTLLLESGRFYVGWSSAVENRIAQHFSGAGSKWTIQHKPLQVLACVPGDTRLEDVVTISLMCQHGWERVRGGRWCQLALEGPPDAVRRAMPPQEPRPEPCSGPAETDAGPCSASQDNAQGGAPEGLQEEQREERETITITRSRADGEQHAWRAEVRSTQAALECAKRGFKCIYAASLPEVTARICEWRQAP